MQTFNPSDLSKLADQCVKCGLCLPSCPSYLQHRNEADSPRGRIALMQGLINGQLMPDDDKLNRHLDQCLHCGNCETACPSSVEYASLLHQTTFRYPLNKTPLWMLNLLSSARWYKRGLKLTRLLPGALKRVFDGFTGRMLDFSETLHSVNDYQHKAIQKTRSKGRIAVFTGCAGQSIDAEAIRLTSGFLSRIGYEVLIPDQQVCCGAMHYHEGYETKAQQFASKNIETFSQTKADFILYFASGCGGHLLAYENFIPQSFETPVIEATEFLSKHCQNNVDSLLTQHQDSIAIHAPCTLRNQTDAWPITLELINKLTKNQAIELPDNHFCCGSAGLHMLKHPEAADAMVDPKIDALKQLDADILLTSNTGCALHFRHAVKRAGIDVKIMHPAEWISRQLSE